MRLEVLLFARLAELGEADRISVEVEPGASAARLLEQVGCDVPALAGTLAGVRVAADHRYLAPEEEIPPAAEIALIPPVSGG